MATRPRIQRIRISAPDRRTLDALLYETPVDRLGGAPKRHEDGSVSIEALVPESSLTGLANRGVATEILDEDVEATLRARQRAATPGDPFGDGPVPRGLGRKIREGGDGGLP